MNLSDQIEDSESKLRNLLEDFFIQVFGKTNLSSHNLDHHKRVWSYARELLSLNEFIMPEEYDIHFVDKLLIASYLHDSGMSVETGPRHGLHSRLFCEKFLLENNMNLADFDDLLRTIENHDRKEYTEKDNPPALLVYLSVADDLDALGFIGVYRYLEIYLMREVDFRELGHLILSNAKGRFDNFIHYFHKFPRLISRHRERYNVIPGFFNSYNKEYPDYDFGNRMPSGICGVADIISCSVSRQMSLEGLFEVAESFMDDQVISKFFKNLRNELAASQES